MDMVQQNLDIFLISETKIDNTFPDAQFVCNGYANPHRRDVWVEEVYSCVLTTISLSAF